MSGTLDAIYVARAGGAPMEAPATASLVIGQGIAGDRYAAGTGYWTGNGDAELTLITSELLRDLASCGLAVLRGEHRRNLVVSGVPLERLVGQRLRIGEGEIEVTGLCPPCRYLETITQPGMRDAMAHGRAGVAARVTRSGTISVGHSVVPLGG